MARFASRRAGSHSGSHSLRRAIHARRRQRDDSRAGRHRALHAQHRRRDSGRLATSVAFDVALPSRLRRSCDWRIWNVKFRRIRLDDLVGELQQFLPRRGCTRRRKCDDGRRARCQQRGRSGAYQCSDAERRAERSGACRTGRRRSDRESRKRHQWRCVLRRARHRHARRGIQHPHQLCAFALADEHHQRGALRPGDVAADHAIRGQEQFRCDSAWRPAPWSCREHVPAPAGLQ